MYLFSILQEIKNLEDYNRRRCIKTILRIELFEQRVIVSDSSF